MSAKEDLPIEAELAARLLVLEAFVAALVGQHLSGQDIEDIRSSMTQTGTVAGNLFAQVLDDFVARCKTVQTPPAIGAVIVEDGQALEG